MIAKKKITKLPLSEDVFLALRLYGADVEASVMLRDRVAALEQENEGLRQRAEGLERANALAKSYLTKEEWLRVGQALAEEEVDA